jgi:hypothetical protein
MTERKLTDERLAELERVADSRIEAHEHTQSVFSDDVKILVAMARQGRHADALAEALETAKGWISTFELHGVRFALSQKEYLPDGEKLDAALSAYRKGEEA